MVRVFHAYVPVRTLFLAATDALMIASGMFFAAAFGWSGHIHANPFHEPNVVKIAMTCFVCVLTTHYYDLYSSQVVANVREVAARLSQVLGTACIILALLYYAYPNIQLRPAVLLLGVALAGILLFADRKIFFALSATPRLTQRAMLLAHGPLASLLAREIEARPELGMHLVGYLEAPQEPVTHPNGLRRLGSLDDLIAVAERERVRHLIVTMGERRGRLPLEALLELKSRGVLVEDGADVYEMISGKVPIRSLHLGWLVFSPGFRVKKSTLVYKRILSIAVSSVGLVLALPLLLLIALAVRLDSSGPVLFRQKRVGKDGKLFTLYKIRTMHLDADAGGLARPVEKNDLRLTRVGRWLRRFRLDEIPQLYNILRGDMYFIGPRPFVPEQEEACARQIPYYRYRWTVKPGATGWAQINRGYCATIEDNTEKLAYDLFYVKNMSLGLDLLILFQTLKILVLGRGGR